MKIEPNFKIAVITLVVWTSFVLSSCNPNTFENLHQTRYSKINVSSEIEILSNLKSNTQLIIAEGNYEFSNHIEIYELSEFSMIGNGQVTFTNNNLDENCLIIYNSKSIGIENIFFTHKSKPNYNCSAGVVEVYRSSDIFLNSCTLDGSGIIGLNLDTAFNIELRKSTIQNCTEDILLMKNKSQCLIIESKLINNFCGTDCIEIRDAGNMLKIDNSEILDNKFHNDVIDDSVYSFILTQKEGNDVKLHKCRIINNVNMMVIGIPDSAILNCEINLDSKK